MSSEAEKARLGECLTRCALHAARAARDASERWVLGACLVTTLLCQFATNSLKATIGDATLFAYSGRLVLNGAIPYRDFWENKPPGIFYIEAFAYWLFGTTWLAPTVLQALVYLATIVAFAALGKKLLPQSALQRAAFLVLFTAWMNLPVFIMDGSNLTQDYLLLPTALCLYFLDPLAERPRCGRWFWAGFFAGIGFLIRPNAIALGGVAAIALLVHVGRLRADPLLADAASPRPFPLLGVWSRRDLLRHVAAFAVGGSVPLLVATLHFARYGLAQEMWFATLGYNVTAYKELFLNAPTLTDRRRYFMLEPDLGVVALYVAGILGAVVTVWRRKHWPEPEARQRLAGLVIAGAWVAGDFLMVIATGHPYAHYAFMLVPSASFAAALLFEPEARAPSREAGESWRAGFLPRWALRAVGALGIVMLGAPLVGPIPSQILAGMRRMAAPFPTTDQQVALFLRQITTPTDPILTLGHFHGHMMYLGNPPAVPQLSTFHLKSGWGNARWTPQYIRTLETAPPKAVVITDGYWDPYAKRGPVKPGQRARDALRPRIEQLVRERYAPAPMKFAGRRVYLRRDVQPPPVQPTYLPQATDTENWL